MHTFLDASVLSYLFYIIYCTAICVSRMFRTKSVFVYIRISQYTTCCSLCKMQPISIISILLCNHFDGDLF